MKLAVIKKYLPWWSKIVVKIILSRIPAGYKVWQNLGLFRHGNMDKYSYALNIFSAHLKRAKIENSIDGKVVLEMGPGDSISTAIIANAHNAQAILVDVGRYAVDDPQRYSGLIQFLDSKGMDIDSVENMNSIDNLLDAYNGKYLIDGLESLKSIASDSVDFIFSQAVLEHVRKDEFLDVMKECCRILKPGGVCSHRIDLRDHLGGGLNNLRFSSATWESDFFVRSGFYTNRIQFEEMNRLFDEAGFLVDVTYTNRRSAMPIKRSQMSSEFASIPDSELMISMFDVVLTHKAVA